MRIALISEHASPLAAVGGIDAGGQNIYVDHIARRLARMGHIVDVFTRRDEARLASIVRVGPNLRVVHLDAGPPAFVAKEELLPHMREFSERLVRFCAAGAGQYDVAHANFFMSGIAASALKRACGVPFVITFHALGRVRRLHQATADRFPVERETIEEQLARSADRVIAECPQDRADLVQLYGAPPTRINIVPCGFDDAELGPGPRDARTALGIGAEEFVVLQLGRMVPRKGIDNVVRAIGELRRRHGLVARLVIVGGSTARPDPAATPEIGRLQAIAREEGVADQVLFAGRRDRGELRAMYCAADVFVTTPWYEPFGITPLEAMACGLPVIGAAVGGIKFSVIDRVTGYLVPPRDPVALVERLARLACDPAHAQALGRAGLRRAQRMFTWQRVALSLARIYAEAASRSDSGVSVRGVARRVASVERLA